MLKRILSFAKTSVSVIDRIYNSGCKIVNRYPSRLDFIQENYSDLVRMVNDKNYMRPNYDGPLKDVHLKMSHPMIPTGDPDSAQDIFDIRHGFKLSKNAKDIIENGRLTMMAYISLGLWIYDKQVFKFSDQLIDEFVNFGTGDGGIPIELFKKLPFKSICVDLHDNGIIDGCEQQIEFIIITPIFIDKDFYCTINVINTDSEDSEISFISSSFSNYKEDQERNLLNIHSFKMSEEQLREYGLATIIGINCLAYLISAKPDIEENKIQKSLYRPTKFVKNMQREIRMWDVGFRYTNSIKETHNSIAKNDTESRTGSSKRPHVRKAHWHRYWVGRGKDKHLELRWISSCHVNVNFVSELPIVTHEEGETR